MEELDVERRLEKVLAWAKDTLAELELQERIRGEVSENLEKRQREVILREQLHAIRKELGEETEEDVVETYRSKIADAGMPDDVRQQAEAEVGRLERTSEQSPEHGWNPGPTSTGCSTSRGTCGATTPSRSRRPVASSMRTTTGSRM